MFGLLRSYKMQYKLTKPIFGNTESSIIHCVDTNTWIPMDEANTDYQAYLAWLADGNEPLPADE